MPDEVKSFSGSFVLDLRIWWRQAHTLYLEKLNYRVLAGIAIGVFEPHKPHYHDKVMTHVEELMDVVMCGKCWDISSESLQGNEKLKHVLPGT